MSIFDTQPSLNEALRVLDCRIREIDSKVRVLQGLEISRQEEVVQALGTKCVVKDCTNHTHQGSFVGLLCTPCHSFISGGDGGVYSQVARNTKREWVGQPEQEPVAWHTEDHLTDRSATTYSKDMVYRWECKGWPVTPLYTTPPQPKREWVGLTGLEVEEAYCSVSDKEWAIGGLTDARVFFCAIEAKLKEKNT